jgi:hypothetical protein
LELVEIGKQREREEEEGMVLTCTGKLCVAVGKGFGGVREAALEARR